jgi:Ca2+-binding RTX toxin-like protein
VLGGHDALVLGGPGSDLLMGAAGHDTISGGLGDDTIVGGRGDELIAGGAGHDTIIAGAGHDTISGGPGNDSIVLHRGVDDLRYGIGDGHDTVVGFSQSGGDRISFAGADHDTIASVVASAHTAGGDTTISLPDGSTITLVGITHIDQGFFK